MTAHVVEAIPIIKFRHHNPIGYRWRCSCGRERYGTHASEDSAIQAGSEHFRDQS